MVEQIDAGVEQLIADNGTPQLEDGHTRIANELLEAIISFDFSKRQYKVVLFVLRKTYGWNKKADVMSLSQIMEGTGLDRSNASKTLAELSEMKVLLKQQHSAGQLIELNKKYKSWGVLLNQPHVVKTTTKVWLKQPSAVVKTTTTKDTTKRQLKTTIPNDFGISERIRVWAEKNVHHSLDIHLENFIGVCRAKGYRYVDWDEAFMNAIRNNWANVQSAPAAPRRKTV
jgi:phage replication O-like protein O